MTPRAQRLAVLVLAAAGFGAGIAVAIWSSGMLSVPAGREAAALPRISGDFTLVAGDGSDVRWSELGGRLQLVFFGFTHCPEACPVTLSTAAQAIRSLGDAGTTVRVLLISVDPERDTPQAVQAYTAAFGAQVAGFTGSAEQIAAAAKAFGVFYEKVPMSAPGDYMVNHTASLFVLGLRDQILEILPYGASAAELAGALRRHL